MYSDLEFQTRKSESWIVRCIERGKEDEGVKFWKFNVSKKMMVFMTNYLICLN